MLQSVLISGNWATVELHAEATAKGGWAFDNQYCWLLEFRHGLVQVSSFLYSIACAPAQCSGITWGVDCIAPILYTWHTT
jgi:hypothetical protein